MKDISKILIGIKVQTYIRLGLWLSSIHVDDFTKWDRVVEFANDKERTHDQLVKVMIAHQLGMGAQCMLQAGPNHLENLLRLDVQLGAEVPKAK